jgi:hypothetical protein
VQYNHPLLSQLSYSLTYEILGNIYEINIYDTIHRYACSLLRQGMKQITITLETSDIIALEKGSDKAAAAKVRKL